MDSRWLRLLRSFGCATSLLLACTQNPTYQSGSCGNGSVDSGELCDYAITKGRPGACPDNDDCNDGDLCTQDVVQNGGTCQASCVHPPVAGCINCGDGRLQAGEICDNAIATGNPGACPVNCDDRISCTSDALMGADCLRQCTFTPITVMGPMDGCCPANASNATDPDCSPSCGNGIKEAPAESCDTAITSGPDRCPTAATCIDANPCTTDGIISDGTCNAQCTHTPITAVGPNDGCCPPLGNANTDPNCTAMCGNGVVETGENCDPTAPSGMGKCPTLVADCGTPGTCMVFSLTGSGCATRCVPMPQTACVNGDQCCPSGCTNATDNNCMATCTDGVKDGMETGVDCGGSSSCQRCPVGQGCAGNGDCTSLVCSATLCQKPAPPVLTATVPAASSPHNDNMPKVKGTAASGMTIKIYSDMLCTLPVGGLGSGTDVELANPGISITVPPNMATTLHATATDTRSEVSNCSAAGPTYTEDSLAPTFLGASDASISGTDVVVTWMTLATDTVTTDPANMSYEICYSLAIMPELCNGTMFTANKTVTGLTMAPGSATISGLAPPLVQYRFVVRALDEAQNRESNDIGVVPP